VSHPLDKKLWQKKGLTVLEIAYYLGYSDREILRMARRWEERRLLSTDHARIERLKPLLESVGERFKNLLALYNHKWGKIIR